VISRLAKAFSKACRESRTALFHQHLHPTEQDKILDLGSEDGSRIAEMIPFRNSVFIADIGKESLLRGAMRYGFKTVLLDESGSLPFEDKYFDIVHCNSVIEHVTVDKSQQLSFRSDREFRTAAFARQMKFASEIRRISRCYFVQTPNRNFFIESHTWLPFVQFLPRSVLIKVIAFFNKWWPKKTSPDWNLLTEAEMRQLFPDATIVREKIAGMTKSFVAIKKSRL
jgi:hypothetical protein